MERLTLVGVTHGVVSYKPMPGNYEMVKRILEEVQPGFVSIEMRLSEFFSKILYRDFSDPPQVREAKLLTKPEYGAEYSAAIIYCRRHGIPLHFIDLWINPVDEVVKTNVLDFPDPREIWIEPEPFPWDLTRGSDDMNKRNVFMGAALNGLLKKYPSPMRGVHVGGARHYLGSSQTSRIYPIQSFLDPAQVRVLPYCLTSF